MKNIYLFASEIAIITGHNTYENVSSIIYKLWEKHFKDDLQYTKKSLLDKNIKIKPIENNDECINRISKEYNINLKNHINECLKSNDVENLNKTQTQILEQCKNMNKEDLNLIKKSLISKTNTNFGTKYEGTSIEIYQQKLKKHVNLITNFLKKKIGTSNEINWYIGGKIDGITDDKILVEVKNRTKRLFYKLRDYEKVQITTYLKILNIDKAHLVESLKNNNNDMNIIEVEFDDKFWKEQILNRLVLFIEFFNNFMSDNDLKYSLLNDPLEIDTYYDSFINC